MQHAATTGLVLLYGWEMLRKCVFVVFGFVETELAFSAVERVHSVALLPSEPPPELASDPHPNMWLSNGHIEFSDVHMSYSQSGRHSLAGLSLVVQAGTKVDHQLCL